MMHVSGSDAPRVLIVDDEQELVSALVERLNLRGFRATGVTTGSDALAWIEREPCDVVLLDVKMPGLGGLDVIRRIKRGHPALEVILLTGHGSPDAAREGRDAGAYAYLMKPVKIDELAGVLRSAGRSRKAEEK